jgi:hypothetical protein
MDRLLRRMTKEGERAAFAAFGLPSQPALGSVSIKTPVKAPGLPGPAKLPQSPTMPTAGSGGIGLDAAKTAFAVGMGASNSTSGSGAVAGEPADIGRRQRSVIDRTFQANEDNFATSSMPMPGSVAP